MTVYKALADRIIIECFSHEYVTQEERDKLENVLKDFLSERVSSAVILEDVYV